MARRIKIKRSTPSTDTGTDTPDSLKYLGTTYTVGETLKVKPNGSGFWKEAVLRRFAFDKNGEPVLTFYVDPPGWVTVGIDQVKKPKIGRKRRDRKN